MPVYEFECRVCGENFESILKDKDPAPPCPKCGSKDTQKKLSTFGSVFQKGKSFFNQCYAPS